MLLILSVCQSDVRLEKFKGTFDELKNEFLDSHVINEFSEALNCYPKSTYCYHKPYQRYTSAFEAQLKRSDL